jgi:hypothetical protein
MRQTIVFSRNEYGTYRVTPGNVIVSKGDPNVTVWNFTGQPLTVTFGWPSRGIDIPQGVSTITLPILDVEPNQYSYRAQVDGTPFIVQGGSGPGIIITP